MGEKRYIENVKCLICNSSDFKFIANISSKPEMETEFGIPKNDYDRNIYKCQICEVYFNMHNLILDNVYEEKYNQATYNKDLLGVFNKIRNLPEDGSDNKQRVKRVTKYLKDIMKIPSETKVLDVGSGLCVFLAELKEIGFRTYCIDPDPLSVKHALAHAKVYGAFTGNLESFVSDIKFDLITLNKVLEHIINPVDVLNAAKKLLNNRGVIYLELPDGDTALKYGDIINREEFYIEHHTVFNENSARLLAQKAGLKVLEIKSVHEPSDKYTLYAFLSPSLH